VISDNFDIPVGKTKNQRNEIRASIMEEGEIVEITIDEENSDTDTVEIIEDGQNLCISVIEKLYKNEQSDKAFK